MLEARVHCSNMSTYEIEIKTLLGEKENADTLKESLKAKGFNIDSPKKASHLNHYFIYENLNAFGDAVLQYIPDEKKHTFIKLMKEGSNFSVRTRGTEGKAILVVKASLGSDSTVHGVARTEFETEIPLSLEVLDQILLDAGLSYQAKWSREREEYTNGDMVVCIDKNAGYGYLAEFEKVIEDGSLADQTRAEILSFMSEVNLSELPQDRLDRMFEYYNEHWPEYYGTNKTFIVE